MKIKWLIALYVFLLLASGVLAQTVSPPISECGKKCSGQFQIGNGNLQPFVVIIDPVSFTVDANGRAVYRTLDEGVHITLSEQSAKVYPKQAHIFWYKISCDHLPCWTTFRTTIVVGHTAEGMAVAIHLPATVYVCERAKGCRDSVLPLFGMKASN